MTHADILTAVTERETRLNEIITRYGLTPINVPPFFACTAQDLAAVPDKIERKVA